jgi:hypothetical protein
MNHERLSILQSMDFVFDAVGSKWEDRFCLFKNFMKKYGSFDRIPCPKKLKREDFSLEELIALNKVRNWIRVSHPVDDRAKRMICVVFLYDLTETSYLRS